MEGNIWKDKITTFFWKINNKIFRGKIKKEMKKSEKELEGIYGKIK